MVVMGGGIFTPMATLPDVVKDEQLGHLGEYLAAKILKELEISFEDLDSLQRLPAASFRSSFCGHGYRRAHRSSGTAKMCVVPAADANGTCRELPNTSACESRRRSSSSMDYPRRS